LEKGGLECQIFALTAGKKRLQLPTGNGYLDAVARKPNKTQSSNSEATAP
jgi:hypothetical protein